MLICKQRRRDLICALSTSMIVFIAMYWLVGLAENGIDTPLAYDGGDTISLYYVLKTIKDSGWIGYNKLLGAPFGAELFDFSVSFLMNTELVIFKILSLFIKNIVVAINIQYLLIFPLCTLSAFFVLKEFKISTIWAIIGSVFFSTAPYIQWRGIGHLMLSASYFVPLSILVCVWAFQDNGRYLSINKSFFFYKKNICALFFFALIANNGGGYYAFFTCFFLCVTGLYKAILHKKIIALRESLISVIFIVIFFLLALFPTILYQLSNGTNLSITERSFAESEIFGLKIAQFFIPTETHGVDFLNALKETYNGAAPLITENSSAYLGVGGVIGFLILVIFLFVPVSDNNMGSISYIKLFSQLTIFAILFCTIGGFSSFFSMVFKFLRSYNRISIFIQFMSVSALCICLNNLCNSQFKKASYLKKYTITILLLGLLLIGICFQLPMYGANDFALSTNKDKYMSDRLFVEEIENRLQKGDMVYQLPYHQFPEAGSVNNMGDYSLFVGYLHSDNLKWSYGGMKGREPDKWNQTISALPLQEMINRIISAGFRGIYIDTRAYDSETLTQLLGDIEAILKIPPLFSGDNTLCFYNLYPYIQTHPELTAKSLPKEDLYLLGNPYSIELGQEVFFDSAVSLDAHRYFLKGISGTESNFAWTDGNDVKMKLYITESVEADVELEMKYINVYRGTQRVTVECGTTILFDEVIGEAPNVLSVKIPKECFSNGSLELTLYFPEAISPKELGESSDGRKLALAITSFSLTR